MNRTKSLALGLLLLSTTGCVGTYEYVPVQAPAGPVASSTRWSFVWGLFKDHVDSPPASCANNPNAFECLKCHGNGITNVTVKTNIAFELLSLLSLGLVTPVHVSYQCAAPSP